MTGIKMLSSSYRKLLAKGGSVRPKNMAKIEISTEAMSAAHSISMGVFEDCCNAGMPFQDSVVAIYLTGLQNGSNCGNK